MKKLGKDAGENMNRGMGRVWEMGSRRSFGRDSFLTAMEKNIIDHIENKNSSRELEMALHKPQKRVEDGNDRMGAR